MDKKLQNLLRWSVNKKTPPLQIQIHFTNFCNLDCIFCPTKALVKDLDRKNELSEDELIKLVKEGNKLGVEEWHICGGGEPLFFKDSSLKIMQLIKKSGKVGEIITNGTLINEEISKEIVNICWDKIIFSLDSPVKEINDSIRGNGSFEKVINAVKSISKNKSKLNKSSPSMFIHTVICNKNYSHIPQLIDLANKIGCEGIIITPLNIWSKKTEKLKLNNKQIKELKKYLKSAKRKAEKLKINHNIGNFSDLELFRNASQMNKVYKGRIKNLKGAFSSSCYMPWFNISIFPDGRAVPCFLLKDKGENVKKKSLKDIWYGNYFNKIRKKLFEDGVSDECARCNAYNVVDNQKLQESIQKFHQKGGSIDLKRKQGAIALRFRICSKLKKIKQEVSRWKKKK